MRLFFDQNISHRILSKLSNDFAGSTSVKAENLTDANDKQIWNFAKENAFTIVTQDADFNDLNLLYGFPPKVIWIRTGNLDTNSIVALLEQHKAQLIYFLKDEELGCFEIIKLIGTNPII